MFKLNRSLIVSMAFLLMLPLFAGRGGGGSFSSGSSSSRSSFSSPSRPSSSPIIRPSGGSFSSKPSSSTTNSNRGGGFFGSSTSRATAPSSQAYVRSQQSIQASSQAKASLAQFKAPPSAPPTQTQIASSPVFGKMYAVKSAATGGTPAVVAPRVTYNTYVVQRQSYYSGYHRPLYMTDYHPSYGSWDALWMWMMLDNMNDRLYYNHRNEAEYRQWRADADLQAMKDASVKAKLEAMDAKVSALQAAQTPVDPTYMPQGVDPSVAMALTVADTALPHEAPVAAPPTDTSDNEDPLSGVTTGDFWWLGGWGVGIGAVAYGCYYFISRKNRPRRTYHSRFDL